MLKKFTTLLCVGALAVAFVGCEQAEDAAGDVADGATDVAGDVVDGAEDVVADTAVVVEEDAAKVEEAASE